MSQPTSPNSAPCSLQRRTLLKWLPAAAVVSAIPDTTSAARFGPVSASEIQASLLKLWDGPLRQPSAVIRPGSLEVINGMIAGRGAAFVSLWQGGSTAPDTANVHQGFYAESGRRFGQINVEVAFRQSTGLFQTQRLVERSYLLRGRVGFDSGNLIGFLRQFGSVYGQRFVIYKPYNDRCGYLIGTMDGIVPKEKQSICIGEFKAERFASFFALLRGGSNIEVEKIRFPYRRPYISEELEH
jgi:hypothetical protein